MGEADGAGVGEGGTGVLEAAGRVATGAARGFCAAAMNKLLRIIKAKAPIAKNKNFGDVIRLDRFNMLELPVSTHQPVTAGTCDGEGALTKFKLLDFSTVGGIDAALADDQRKITLGAGSLASQIG